MACTLLFNAQYLILNSNGQLLLDLRGGASQQSFKAAILKTLSTKPSAAISRAPANSTCPNNPSSSRTIQAPSQSLQQIDVPDDESSQPSLSPATSAQGSNPSTAPASSNAPKSAVESLLAERRNKLEKDRKEKEAAEKAESSARAQARNATVTLDPNSAKAQQATFAQQQRQRQYDAKLERERIVRQIEQDKIERREREERRKALAKAASEGFDAIGEDGKSQSAEPTYNCHSTTSNHAPKVSKSPECALQVRLLDGSTIRSKFLSKNTLRTHVRQWVRETRLDGEIPYSFKQILAPSPNRMLSISDEETTLQDLGLAPTSTLVMVPVQNYTAAYTADEGLLSRGTASGYNVISTGARMVIGALGTFLGFGQTTAQEQTDGLDQRRGEGAVAEQRPSAAILGTNVRTIHDQQNERDVHQLYNGNQVRSCIP
ncbi:MAG: hypothetical protein Q9217_004383 [Psora testacea]